MAYVQPMQQQQQQQQQQQMQVVVQQPEANNLQRAGYPQNVRGWSSGICGCCANLTTCCLGTFCFTCLMCRVAAKMDESCCVPLCLVGGTIAMRTKVRTQFGIEGSICGDWCCMTCCPVLAMCQLDRELQHFGL